MQDNSYLYYTTDKLSVFDAMLGTQMSFGGLAVSHADPNIIKFHLNGSPTLTPKPVPLLTKMEVVDVEHPSFRQELIYNGRSADTLKVLYREDSSDILRAPFSQVVQHELKDGTTIEFKGARIAVIEATNTRLRYSILSSFPDTP